SSSGIDGPYSVESFVIHNLDGEEVLSIPQVQYVTEPYNHTSFNGLLVQADPNSFDDTITPDSYCISFDLTVETAGWVNMYSMIQSPEMEKSWEMTNSSSLEEGTHRLKMKLLCFKKTELLDWNCA